MNKTLIGRRVALAASLALVGGSAWAAWPEREVQMVVNYGAGGNTDVASRELARAMAAELGKPVVVTNRPGALGTLAPAWLTSQQPDGYTLGVVTYSAVAITPLLMKVPYKTDDFTYVGAFGRYRYGVVVKASSPYRTLQDLVEAGKRKPVFFGAPSAPNNLAMFDLARVSGAKFEQVSYKSGNDTVVALLSGQVEVIVQNPSDVMAQIEAGELRILASASPVRWPEFPDVPTMKEAGYDVEIDSWLGLAVPKGTPQDVVARLEGAMIAASRNPAMVQAFKRIGVDPAGIPGAQYRDMALTGYERTKASVEASPIPSIAQ
ncbi:Bug family tripartite tricarboxylate transporter substrate binding protein [Teichococcus oryzae]|uniref:Tripartite tricarboxylate transporter substrate binding protein n=1 Tax=Teichococcus oryzae TaxID=1608942 RepID=A0A5B2THU8_9PROT|nr:tripartite tricarboxylate transporter substrate binding protein [Pseudoroseomonas oryzae]KAA2213575.1 tripartite tricarboxylate transporter substrate binding protein [Pseudoroseomonas oryzae]